ISECPAQPDVDADVLKNLRPGRPAHRLRHRESRFRYCAGKNPAAIQRQSAAQTAALAALDDVEHVRKTRRNNFAGLEFFERAFRDLKLEFIPSAANFILVRVGDGRKIFEALQRQGVIVRPMGGYQLPEWIRISIGTPEQNERCLKALRATLK